MNRNNLLWGGIPALLALAALAAGGYYVARTPPTLAAEYTWNYPAVDECHVAAEGFLVRVIVDGNPVKTDTVYTNVYQLDPPVGSTQIKVAGFYTMGGSMYVGREMTPSCEVLPDTAWSVLSNPQLIRPQVGRIINLQTSVIIDD